MVLLNDQIRVSRTARSNNFPGTPGLPFIRTDFEYQVFSFALMVQIGKEQPFLPTLRGIIDHTSFTNGIGQLGFDVHRVPFGTRASTCCHDAVFGIARLVATIQQNAAVGQFGSGIFVAASIVHVRA